MPRLRRGTSGGIGPDASVDPWLLFMKRKIAAIFAADIAGYSRLVAEDEEETLRRLASYRQVTDDFIAKGGGRIFNTAGDAVLAEFPSAVEAVRCAIDIQESLRTRNMAYPPSRMWPVAVTVVSLAAIGVGGFLYFTKLETLAPSKVAAPTSVPSPAPSAAAAPPPAALPAAAPTPIPAATAAMVPPPSPSPPVVVSSDKFAAAGIPFISDKVRASLASDYPPAADFKAFSLNIGGFNAFVTAQPSEEAGKSAAVEQFQKGADAAASPRKCGVYAVGGTGGCSHGRPPMPPLPWIRHGDA